MSLSQPLAAGRRSGDEEPLVRSCSARVLILIDIAELPAAAEKRANGAASGRAARAAAGVIDGLRLSVLRVLTQLCISRPANSWVEWAPRFFDSRPGGVGKTPAELRSRLRSRQVPQGVGVRGFRKVTQASFSTFGDACLAMACGVQRDPLARDRETALRRWAHGQKKHPPNSTWMQPRPSEPGANSGPCPADAEDSRDDVSRRMYAGHDMSSHEVVVRSLLEVLQEFDDASEGDRTAAPSIARGGNGNGNGNANANANGHDKQKLQLLLLHSAFPRTDEDAEQFALRGNFTTEALEPPETRATALDVDHLLNANLGKAVARARSRGVSFLWQEGGGHNSSSNSSIGDRGDEAGVGPNQRGSCLQRCLSAAGGSGVLHWGRVVRSTGLLPPSAALGRRFGQRQAGERWRTPGLDESDVTVAEGRKEGAVVGVDVALNRRGDADVHLVASSVSGVADSTEASDCPNVSGSTSGRGERAGAALLPEAVGTSTGTAAGTTPWRLMGTVPIDEVWSSCLEGQGWGATRILRAGGDGDGDGDCGRGAQLWRGFLGELVAEEMAGVMTLPQRLFGCDTMPMPNSDGDARHAARLQEALAVALVVPISDECAVCFSTRRLAATLPGEQESGAGPRATTTEGLSSAGERGASGDASGGLPPADYFCDASTRAELVLNRRGVEVGLAMQESSLARKRRRQAKSVPGKGARGMKFAGSSIAGVEGRRAGAGAGSGSGGGLSGSLSQRDSGSLCFTGEGEGEGMSGDGAACDVRQWRLEMEMASVTSNGSVKSASPRGYQLFNSTNSTPGGATVAEGEEDDDRISSTGSSSLSGPKRALYQALEDVSSRSSLLGPDADSSSTSTLESKEGGGWSAGAPAAQRVDGDATASRSRGQRECVFPSVDDAGEEETDLSDVVDAGVGASVLPLSLMSEPALACLPGPALPAELVALAERCSHSNQAMAATAAALGSKPENASDQTDLVGSEPQTASQRRGGARQKFIDAVRSSERTRQAAAAAVTPAIPAEGTGTVEEAVSAPVIGDVHIPEEPMPEGREGREEDTHRVERGDWAKGDALGTLEGGGRLFEESVSRGVAGLQMQYREVVEGGQRSPVEFVVCAVPEAIREMVDGGKPLSGSVGHPTDGDGDAGGDDQHVRAAHVLAAVVSGLTSRPKELSSKHRKNKSAGASSSSSASASGAGAAEAGAGAGASTSAAKPAVQKIRDYQLQALLLCQLNSLAMDLPEAPESLQAFFSLAASEMGDASGDGNDSKSKKSKGKGKRKKRKKKGTAPSTRPSDPLPDCRRTRLVDYLQPISTMLDACTVTKPPPVDNGGGRGGTSADGDKGKTKGKGSQSQSRAYDGTLADFMGLALVEHFADRLPRTLAALFEDFECHPPDALTAALVGTGTPSSARRSATGGAVAAGSEAGGGSSKEADSGTGGALHAPAAEEALAAGSAPKNDVALSSSRGSTAGILLSDRTAMSHNHFKMSGVLNGYREVKLKGHTASGGGLRPSVLGKVSGNGQGGRDNYGSGGSGDSEEWRRTSNGEGKGKSNDKSRRGARSRATRDSKRASASASASAGPGTGQQSPASKPARAPGIRQSPRLNRKRPSRDGDGDGDGDLDGDEEGIGVSMAKKSVAGSKRPLSEAEAASASPLSAIATPGRKRRLAAVAPGGGVPRARARARAGVLVGETPQKRPGGSIGICGTSAGVRSSGRRGGRASRTSIYEDQERDQDQGDDASPAVAGIASPASPATAGSASRKPSKRRVPAEARVAASPTLPMNSPSAGPKKRRRAAAAGPASPVESLFVAESPGVSTGSAPRSGRSGWAAGADTDGDGLSRQLMAEGASPVGLGRRRGGAVVSDTPA